MLFTDIVQAPESAAALGDRRWREVLEQHHALVRRELNRFRGREIDTAGDGFLATFDGPACAIRCATAIRDGVRRLGLEVRAGGLAVHIGARVAAAVDPGQVLVSTTGLEFAYSQAPREMKSTIMRFWNLTVTVGNLITAGVAALNVFTGAMQYLFFAALIFVAAVVFGLLARRYVVVDYFQRRSAGAAPAPAA